MRMRLRLRMRNLNTNVNWLGGDNMGMGCPTLCDVGSGHGCWVHSSVLLDPPCLVSMEGVGQLLAGRGAIL